MAVLIRLNLCVGTISLKMGKKKHTYTLLKQGCSGSSMPQCDSYSSTKPPSESGPWLRIFLGWKWMVQLLPGDPWWGKEGDGGCVGWRRCSGVTSEVVGGGALLRGSTLVESRCDWIFLQREHQDKVRHFATAVVFTWEYLSSVIQACVCLGPPLILTNLIKRDTIIFLSVRVQSGHTE